MCGPDYSYRSGESEADRKARKIAESQEDVAYYQRELLAAQQKLSSLQSSST